MNTKKTLSVLIIILVAGVLLSVFIPVIIKWSESHLINVDPAFQKIKAQNDSLASANRLLLKSDSVYRVKVDSFMVVIANGKEKIVYLKSNMNEKFRVINNFNSSDIYRFFTSFNPDSTLTK